MWRKLPDFRAEKKSVEILSHLWLWCFVLTPIVACITARLLVLWRCWKRSIVAPLIVVARLTQPSAKQSWDEKWLNTCQKGGQLNLNARKPYSWVVSICFPYTLLGESLRGNRTGATGLRASERKSASERVSEREGFQRFLRGFQRLSEILRGFSEVFRGFERFFRGFQRCLRGFQKSSQRPSQRQISSQRLSVLLPLIVLPLELSPNCKHERYYQTSWH